MYLVEKYIFIRFNYTEIFNLIDVFNKKMNFVGKNEVLI